MKLSTRMRYGIRALMEIALHGGGRPVGLPEISKNQNISKKYLHALMVQLKNGGIVTSVRGNAGGYLLTRPPGDVSLYDIFTVLEGPAELVECAPDGRSCARYETCVTRKLWDRLGGAVRRELEEMTLADLVSECGESGTGTYEI